jgi:hypothetical protein
MYKYISYTMIKLMICYSLVCYHVTMSHAVADPESFHWVGIQYRNSALQYDTVLTTCSPLPWSSGIWGSPGPT